MTRHIQPPHLPEQRDLLDCIILMILFIILLYVLPLEAAEVWFQRQPGDRYWHRACTVTCSKHFDEDALKAALEEGMRAALEER